jgi:hypothetical protein
MTEQQRIRAQDVGNELFDALGAIWRWVVLVAAIAVGTCIGLILFGMLVLNGIVREVPNVGSSTTSSVSTR